jgi:hypothetical protein
MRYLRFVVSAVIATAVLVGGVESGTPSLGGTPAFARHHRKHHRHHRKHARKRHHTRRQSAEL